MKTKRRGTTDKNSNNKYFFTSFPFITLLIVIIAGILFFLWHQNSLNEVTDKQGIFPQNLADEIAVPEQVSTKKTTSQSSRGVKQEEIQPGEKTATNTVLKPNESSNSFHNSNNLQETQNIKGSSSNSRASKSNNPDTHTPSSVRSAFTGQSNLTKSCKETTKFFEDFFQHLDDQQYLNEYNIKPDSKKYFIALMQKTFDNPPVVSGETDDLYTILQNTAHFFRIIGNTNIVILKKILGNEKSQFEKVAAKLYSLVTSPACAEQSFGLKVQKSTLYEYAGFFLNTMGGRLYLFRRDSISRMVISYYSILLIDKANIESFNKHGIEISTSIDLLISEMESTTNTLKLKETYLNTLYALQEQYQ